MNQTMPMRKDTSTCLLYLPLIDSRITSPNHMNSVAQSMNRPVKNTHMPHETSLSQLATPSMVTNMAMEPTNGHLLWCGTK